MYRSFPNLYPQVSNMRRFGVRFVSFVGKLYLPTIQGSFRRVNEWNRQRGDDVWQDSTSPDFQAASALPVPRGYQRT